MISNWFYFFISLFFTTKKKHYIKFKVINDENKEGKEGSFLKLHKIGFKMSSNYFLYPEEVIELVWNKKAKIFKLKPFEQWLKIDLSSKNNEDEKIDDCLSLCYEHTDNIYHNLYVLNAWSFFRRRGMFLKRFYDFSCFHFKNIF